LVHVSTDYVFDGEGQRPYTENDAVAPRAVYGASKLEGEREAAADPRALVVRTSWLFGPGGPNFVTTMLRLIEGGQTPLRVVDDQVGAPTYTPFLARALWDLAAQNARGVIHYCNRDAASWCGFARAIVASTRPETEVVPVTTDEFPRPAPRPRYSVLDTGRVERLLGRPVEPWLAGLSDYLATFPRLQGCPGGNR
jgi:dTDP-4-dehydrorhamnose reductase